MPFYAILRAVPDKLQGVIAMGLSLGIYFILPFIYTSRVKGSQFKPLFTFFFWFFAGNVIMLGWLGGKVAAEPYITVSQACTVYYFLYLTVILKVIQELEHSMIVDFTYGELALPRALPRVRKVSFKSNRFRV